MAYINRHRTQFSFFHMLEMDVDVQTNPSINRYQSSEINR
jgi:hypothetical protein